MELMLRTQGTGVNPKNLVVIFLAFFLVIATVLWRSPNLPKSIFYRLIREVAKVQMMIKTRSWPKIEGVHFIVRYLPGDKEGAELALESAEKFYQPVVKNMAYEPKGKILVVLYPTKESLSKSFGWDADQSAMGVYWAGVIRVLSPKEWVNGNTVAEKRDQFENDGPMAHEFTHYLVDYRTKGNYPRWYTEGLALYTEYKLTGFRFRGYNNGALYPLSDMDGNFDNLKDQNLAYRESFAAVKYLVDTYGEDKVHETMNSLGKGQTIEQAVKTVYGVSFDTFEKNFRTWTRTGDNL